MAIHRPSASPLAIACLLLSLSSHASALPQPRPNAMPQPQDDNNGNAVFGPDGLPATTTSTADDTRSDSDQSDRYHYYFIVLVVFALGVLGICVLVVTRRRKKAAIAARARLVSDMDAQRHGRFGVTRQGTHRSQTWGIQMGTWGVCAPDARNPGRERIEGLDERGEAPPPYEHKRGSSDAGHTSDGEDSVVIAAAGHRDEHGVKAPQYDEIVLERPGPIHPADSRRDERGDEAFGQPVRASSTSR